MSQVLNHTRRFINLDAIAQRYAQTLLGRTQELSTIASLLPQRFGNVKEHNGSDRPAAVVL